MTTTATKPTSFGKKDCPNCHQFIGFAHKWGDELECPECGVEYSANALGDLVRFYRHPPTTLSPGARPPGQREKMQTTCS